MIGYRHKCQKNKWTESVGISYFKTIEKRQSFYNILSNLAKIVWKKKRSHTRYQLDNFMIWNIYIYW